MTTGLLSIRERVAHDDEDGTAPKTILNPYSIGPQTTITMTRHEREMAITGGSIKFFLRGMHKKPSADDYVVAQGKKPKLQKFEQHLRAFRYAAALDASLRQGMNPVTVVALLEELIARGDGLQIALAARDDATLEPILHFLDRYLHSPRYTDVLCQVFDAVLSRLMAYSVNAMM